MSYLKNNNDPTERPKGIINCSDLKELSDDAEIVSVRGDAINVEQLRSKSNITRLYLSMLNDDIADSIPELRELRLLSLNQGIQKINEICSDSLEVLIVDASTTLNDFLPFAQCPNLRTIYCWGCLNLSTLNGIAKFDKLSELGIAGAMSKTGTLDTLKPLSNMSSSLSYLSLATKIDDGSIKPISKLVNLEYLWLQNKFKKTDYQAILEACPNLKEIELHNGEFGLNFGFAKFDD